MVEQLRIYNYGEHTLRIVLKNGEAWFVAKDVCSILELSNSREALSRLGDDEKGVSSIYTPGGRQALQVVNESGLYALIFGSRKPEAHSFKRWIIHEVLPAIRRYGAYISPERLDDYLNNPELLSNLARAVRSERRKRDVLEKQLILMQPKAAFADAVSNCKDAIPVGDMAKLICQSGYYIGRNAFFAYLRDNGWLIRQNCHSWNLPTQRGIERGLFIIVETFRDKRKKEVLHRTTMITGKGQVFFMGLFMKKIALELLPVKTEGVNPCRV
jgi:anti-repressor protein